jgi:endonuclease/exonuclease/phosphatase family metal-dependent hydrolase
MPAAAVVDCQPSPLTGRLRVSGGYPEDPTPAKLNIVDGGALYIAEFHIGDSISGTLGASGAVTQTGGDVIMIASQSGTNYSRDLIIGRGSGSGPVAKGQYTISGGTLTYLDMDMYGDPITYNTARLYVGAGVNSLGTHTTEGTFTVVGSGATLIQMKELYVGTESGKTGHKGTMVFQLVDGDVTVVQLTEAVNLNSVGAGATADLLVSLISGTPDNTIVLIENTGTSLVNGVFDTINGGSAAEGAAVVLGGKTYTLTYEYIGSGDYVANDIALVSESLLASKPRPSGSKLFMDPDPNEYLAWCPGIKAQTHNVYFGAAFDDVNDANTFDTTGIYRGRQDSNTYILPEKLQAGQSYYWRIDEVNDPNIWKGNLWSFTYLGRRAKQTERRILSWNIEFLGTREPPRSQAQHDAIAQRILSFDAAVLALQEIYDGSVLEYIRSQMGASWQIYHTWGENALLYDTNKVEMLSLEMLTNLNNPPYTAYPWTWATPVSGIFRPVRMYAEPFRVIGLHCHWNDVDIRTAEGIWLRTKIAEFLADPDEPNDIILLGDLNGAPGTPPHPQLQEGNILYLLPKENGDITHVNDRSQIDHCYVTQDANDKLPKHSAFVIRPEYYGETPLQFDETYSDHYPVFIDLKPSAHTDMVNFTLFAEQWLETGCNFQNSWCGSADLTGDGLVDYADLRQFVEWWLF